LRLWKCGIDIGNGHHYSHSLTSANSSKYNHNNNCDLTQEGEVVAPIAAAIQFLDIERGGGEEEGEGEEEEKAGAQENDNNNNKKKRNKLTMTQFVQRYNSPTDSLSRHFSRPIFSDSCNKIFGEIQYIGIFSTSTVTNSGNCQKL
jgi:hypothetical protein